MTQAGVAGSDAGDFVEDLGRGVEAEVAAHAAGEVGDDFPVFTRFAGPGEDGPDALDAAVGVGVGAVLFGPA